MTENLKIISASEYLSKNKKPNQENVWDEISDLWNEYRKEPFDAVKSFLEEVSTKSSKKIKIIDLGCGSGRNMIKSENIKYYCVDISSCQLKAATKLAKEKEISAEFFKLPADKINKSIFDNETFDYGLFIATLHCIEGESERETALREFYRVLKKGSEALITVWNSEDSRFDGLSGDVYMSWKKNSKEYFRYYYLYSKDELINLLKKTGFKIIKINDKETDRFSKKNLIVRVKK